MISDPQKADNYLRKHAFFPKYIQSDPENDVRIIVVIPCFNEPDIIASLQSLAVCTKPDKGSVEVIIVVNSSDHASELVLNQNAETIKRIEDFKKSDIPFWIKFHIISAENLPKKHAGVGLARKIGMDEAIRRFQQLETENGLITGFDADSLCESNYFTEIETYFSSHPKCPAASVHFEHPLSGLLGSEIYSGIIQYELHLRYYIQALRFAGFPFAFHTIGSSFVVRSDAYISQGGMNRRQAGEDFYFLHKLIPLGNYGEIHTTKIIPSPRASDRVPFGTGRAVNEFLDQNCADIKTYHPQIFIDLKLFIALIPEFWMMTDNQLKGATDCLSKPTKDFLKEADFYKHLNEIKSNSASAKAFIQRFYRWFDGFTVLKFVHYLRDHAYGECLINEAAVRLLELTEYGQFNLPSTETNSLLRIYRELDKSGYPVYEKYLYSSSL